MTTTQKKICIFLCCLIAVLMMVIVSARIYILHFSEEYIIATDHIRDIELCQNVIILGARVYDDGRMSGILRERALAAIDVYNERDVCEILISGDGFEKNGGGDEIVPVKNFLIENGVDPHVIVEDGYGFDTFHSMQNARDIFDCENALIVTQAFHLPRAVYIARTLGIDAMGYTAYKYPYESQWEKRRNFLREFPASVKAIFEVSFRD